MTDEIENNSAEVNAAVMEIFRTRDGKVMEERNRFNAETDVRINTELEKDLAVWGVELDGELLDTPLRTYTEARKQAHRVAQGFDDWFGVRVVKEEAQEDQSEAGQVYSRVISEGGIGLGKSSSYTANRLPADELEEVDDVGVKMIEEALREYWGERCEDYEAGCVVCEVWEAFDKAFPRNENQNGDTK